MLPKNLLKELELFVDNHIRVIEFVECRSSSYEVKDICESIRPHELESFIEDNKEPSFSQILFDFIDKRSTNDTDVYKKVGIDRRHFSKIRSNPDYHPSKKTVIALALALELNEMESNKLLNSTGYSLSDCDTFDLVIQFCLYKKIYNIDDVNMALDYFSIKPLGGVLK